ncbi:MAG: glycoside hydrolase family 3 C-terminal domain-containing protein [Fidelibacterota bacterium]|nr:MAG: glycoside hydrolase family 3 C-terminal domain-containing protein [Candidatus Neomarinimicrobiota bacterium]
MTLGLLLCQGCTESASKVVDVSEIYHDGWIDLNKNGRMDPYENPDLDTEKRITDLLKRMTVEEKTCQMTTLYGFGRVLKDELPTPEWKDRVWKDGIGNIDEHLNGLDRPATTTQYSWPPSRHAEALNTVQRFFVEETRLGIPVDFTDEGIRGLCSEKATSFPAQIGVGSTWDRDLIRRIGQVTGREARALGYTNIYSPILDLARDPRWGRTVECYGEDPYHISELGFQQVRALQSQHVVSTTKHFAVYSAPKGGRDGHARTDPHIAPREVQMVYLKPFRKAFVEGGALGTMSSYNDYDGIPISGSRAFLIDLLRDQWGFKGYVVSDSRAVQFIHSKHHVAEDYKEAVYQAVMGGLNIRTNFTEPEVYIEPLRELIQEGRLSMKVIDERVRPILRNKYWLGLFDQPYVEHPYAADGIVACAAHEAVSLEASRKSIVLLKNEGNLLPLDRKKVRRLLLTGPNATAEKSSIGRYGPNRIDVVSVLEGIQGLVGDELEVMYEPGCEIVDEHWPESEILPQPMPEVVRNSIGRAAARAKTADAAIVVLGEDENIVGESMSRTSLDLPGYQLDLARAIVETGTPTIVVLLNGRPLTVNWIDRHVPAIIEGWFPGKFGGQAIAEVLFGEVNPSGKLPITFPKTVGQIPLNFPFKKGSHAGSIYDTRVKGTLYPFGHGLSYSTFAYDGLEIDASRANPKDKGLQIRISCTVTNTSTRPGDEIVQLYIADVTSSVTTYEQRLCGFERVSLSAGESKQVDLVIGFDELSLVDRQGEWVVEPGLFNVMVGRSSEDIRLAGEFVL